MEIIGKKYLFNLGISFLVNSSCFLLRRRFLILYKIKGRIKDCCLLRMFLRELNIWWDVGVNNFEKFF